MGGERRARKARLQGRDVRTFQQPRSAKSPTPAAYCGKIAACLTNGGTPPEIPRVSAKKEMDATLQAGIRDHAAAKYSTLQSGQSSAAPCVAQVSLADGILVLSGQRRVQTGVGELLFLPIFEGPIDLSRVVSPLRVWTTVPNVICAQVLAVLALRTSLFAGGYQDRLLAVAFNTNFDSRKRDNSSGVITIASTAIGQVSTAALASHLYRVFRELVRAAWTRQKATAFVPDARTG